MLCCRQALHLEFSQSGSKPLRPSMQVPAQSTGAGSRQGAAGDPPDDAIAVRLHSAVEQVAFVVEVKHRTAACGCLRVKHLCGRAHATLPCKAQNAPLCEFWGACAGSCSTAGGWHSRSSDVEHLTCLSSTETAATCLQVGTAAGVDVIQEQMVSLEGAIAAAAGAGHPVKEARRLRHALQGILAEARRAGGQGELLLHLILLLELGMRALLASAARVLLMSCAFRAHQRQAEPRLSAQNVTCGPWSLRHRLAPCADSRDSWHRPGGKVAKQGSPSRSSTDSTSIAAAGAGPSTAPAPNTPRPARQQLASVYQMRMQGGPASSSTLQPGPSCQQEPAGRPRRAPADLRQPARAGAGAAAQGTQQAARSQGGGPEAARSPWGWPNNPGHGQQQVPAEANGGGAGLGLRAGDGPPPPPPPRQQHLQGGLHGSSSGGTWSLGSPEGVVPVAPGMLQSLLPPVPSRPAGQQAPIQHQHNPRTHTSPQLDPLGGPRLLLAGQQATPLPAGLGALEQHQQPAALLQAPGGGSGLAAGAWLPSSPLQGQAQQPGARQEQPVQLPHSAHWQVSSVLLGARVCVCRLAGHPEQHVSLFIEVVGKAPSCLHAH